MWNSDEAFCVCQRSANGPPYRALFCSSVSGILLIFEFLELKCLLTAKVANKVKNYSHMTGATAQLGTTASKRVVFVLQRVSSKPPLVSPLQSCLVEGVTAIQD